MNTCATCKHWDAPKLDPHHSGHGSCPRLYATDGTDPIYISGHELEVNTRPDFGCTLWEAKP